MLQPVTPARALLLLLLAVTAAAAQPKPGRTVTVAARPGEPLPEVRVAAEYTTAIVLDAPVDKDSVQLDTPPGAPRIHVLAVGERSVHFETLVTPGDKELQLGPVVRASDSSIPGRWSVPGDAQQSPQRGVTRPPISGKRS